MDREKIKKEAVFTYFSIETAQNYKFTCKLVLYVRTCVWEK